jgi:hypothetical protein
MPPKLLVAVVPLALLALAADAGQSHAQLIESGFPVRLTGKDLARLVETPAIGCARRHPPSTPTARQRPSVLPMS